MVNIPADRSIFQAKLGVNDLGNTVIKEVLNVQTGKRAKAPKVQIEDQVLNVDCACDSLDIYLKLKDTHITDMLKETVFVPTEKPLSMWQQTQLWMGRVMLIGLTGGLIMLVIIRKIVWIRIGQDLQNEQDAGLIFLGDTNPENSIILVNPDSDKKKKQ